MPYHHGRRRLAAAFRNTRVLGASAQAVACQAVIAAAKHVEAAS